MGHCKNCKHCKDLDGSWGNCQRITSHVCADDGRQRSLHVWAEWGCNLFEERQRGGPWHIEDGRLFYREDGLIDVVSHLDAEEQKQMLDFLNRRWVEQEVAKEEEG